MYTSKTLCLQAFLNLKNINLILYLLLLKTAYGHITKRNVFAS